MASEKGMTRQDEIMRQIKTIKEDDKAVDNERRKLKKSDKYKKRYIYWNGSDILASGTSRMY